MAQVLRPLALKFNSSDFPSLLVGLGAPDDAAVYKISDEQAIIQTLDFFPPIVDDAYAFGAIAAANALSDVYAMGGRVLLALNLAAWREDLPLELLGEILRGGAEKVVEAGAVIAGGHTITDQEPKYGLSVTGMVHPSRIFTKGGAHVGDQLVLTKPIGSGLVTTAGKLDLAFPAHLESAIKWMMTLNRDASEALQTIGVHAVTDVTGYGLAGHALEMATASDLAFRFELNSLPLMEGAFEYAANRVTPGGTARNRDAFAPQVLYQRQVSEAYDNLLFDPQTSGGLLAAVPADKFEELVHELGARQVPMWRIGDVVYGSGIRFV